MSLDYPRQNQSYNGLNVEYTSICKCGFQIDTLRGLLFTSGFQSVTCSRCEQLISVSRPKQELGSKSTAKMTERGWIRARGGGGTRSGKGYLLRCDRYGVVAVATRDG